MFKVSEKIGIPWGEIELRTIQSQGAGGQNVNRVSTAIHLFFNIEESSLSESIKERMLSCGDHRIMASGLVVIKSQESRSQEANREVALERLREIIQAALIVPKRRRATKATRSSKERRLKGKALRSRTKSNRSRPGLND